MIMEKLKFNIAIDAPAERVWDILWRDDTYRAWTKPFNEGSYAVPDSKKDSYTAKDWREGSKVLFLDGNGQGMVSTIARNIPNEYMSIRHLGMIDNGVEDTTSEKVSVWAGAMENYTLKTVNGKTELSIESDITEEYKDMFSKMWPKALETVKRLAEKN